MKNMEDFIVDIFETHRDQRTVSRAWLFEKLRNRPESRHLATMTLNAYLRSALQKLELKGKIQQTNHGRNGLSITYTPAGTKPVETPVPVVKMKNVEHPGAYVAKVLESKMISRKVLCDRYDINASWFAGFVSGRYSCKPEMSVKLATALHFDPALLQQMQAKFDVYQVLNSDT